MDSYIPIVRSRRKGNPVEDQAAIQMGLKLLERCHQVNVYGPVWTEGMWAEIEHAKHFKIKVYTDQKELRKSPPTAEKGGKNCGRDQGR